MTALPLLIALGLAAGPPPAPAGPAAPDKAGAAPSTPTPAPAPAPAKPLPSATLTDDYTPPFPSEDLELSAVLTEAAENNIDLQISATDIDISEAGVLAALGAFDVFLTAGVTASVSETPQRGSQFTISTASRTVGANIGFNRRLETGGTIALTITANRTLQDQQVNFSDPSAGATTLSQYFFIPQLTLTHPLLQGAGLKVNRADINRAKIATSQAEAGRQLTAQNLARDIISAYWDVLFAHRDLVNRRRSVSLAQAQLDRTKALVAAGRLSPVDAKVSEQALVSRESDVLNAENTLLDTSLTMRTLMGQEFSGRKELGILPSTDPIVRARVVNVQDEIDRALKANPQVRQLELALASRRIDELVAANQRLPQLDFSGSFTPQGRSVDTIPNASTGDPGQQGSWAEAFRNIFSEDVGADGLLADWTLTGSLTLTWDIQNRGPKGNHAQAKHEIRRAQLNLKAARQQTSAGVIRAANLLRTQGKVIEVAEVSLELAEENLAAEEARFEVGRSTILEVQTRLDELDAAAAQALSAQIAYLKALVQLQALNGEILPAYGFAP